MRSLKLLILSGLFLTVPVSVNAQRVTGGLKFGITNTTFIGNLAAGETTWESITGVAGGGTAELRIVGGLSAVGELLYLRMGAKTRVQYNDFPGLLTSRASYLSAPVLLQFRFDPSGLVRPRIFLGGAALFVIDSAILVEATDTGQIFIEENESIETLDYGLMVGAGIDFDVASQRLSLEARYYQGQRDVTKPDSETGELTVLNNEGWMIMAGVLF